MTELTLVKYEQNAVAEFGNNFMFALVAAAAAQEEAQRLQETAGAANTTLAFEMTKAVFDLHDRFDDVDVYAVFGKAKDVEKLNQRILTHMGVLKREITSEDEIVYKWTSDSIAALYDYNVELKDRDPAEYARRFNNRKRLNIRLSDAYKAASKLVDLGLSPDDLFYSTHPETNELVPTIRNAPKEIAGDKGEVQLGGRKPVAGATMSPTMSSIVKLASAAHAPEKAEKVDKGDNRDGPAKLGISDEDFGAQVNLLKRTITAQEGKLTKDAIKQMKSLYEFLAPFVTK